MSSDRLALRAARALPLAGAFLLLGTALAELLTSLPDGTLVAAAIAAAAAMLARHPPWHRRRRARSAAPRPTLPTPAHPPTSAAVVDATTLVEQLGSALCTVDLDLHVTAVNAATELLLGHERGQLPGQSLARLLDDASVRTVHRWVRENLFVSAATAELSLTAVHREGRVLQLAATVSMLRAHGVPIGIALLLRDVTARRELDRLHADFLAMVGHDIRNPLGAIFGYAEMLREEVPLAPPYRELLLRITSNTRTVLTLVGNFLETSKIETGGARIERMAVDLNTLVEHVSEQYAAQAQLAGVTVGLAVTPTLPAIEGSGVQLERITANLLTNAIKFTPRGGRVTITTARIESMVSLAVSDTGIGIAPHEFTRVFQRYARAGSRDREGTGLGLYIVATLVDEHGGFLTIDSNPGDGTTVTAYLPIRDWRVPATDPALAPAEDAIVPVEAATRA